MKYLTCLLPQCLCGDSSFKKRVSSGLGPTFCHPISIPTLNIHYAYLKFMKLLVLGDEGIVRIEFLPRYHLLQIRKHTILVVTNLQVHAIQISKDAWSESVMLKRVSWRGELTWSWLATLATSDVVSCKWVLILPWIPRWVRLSWIFKTLIMEMWVAFCKIHLQWGSALSEAKPYRRGAGSVLCLAENLLSLIPQLKPSAKIDTVPLRLLLQNKIKAV